MIGFFVEKGDVGRTQGNGRTVRHQDPEEGHHHPGRRHRVHHGGEARAGHEQPAAVPRPAALVLPDDGSALLRHGIRQRRRSHVPDPAVRQIQGTRRRVRSMSANILFQFNRLSITQ